MNVIQAIILGIIQGLTEFLPVSSSGHLVLFQKIFGITEPTLTFGIVVHLGTLLAVFVVFWKDILDLLKKPFQKLTWLLIAATIPTVIIALVFSDFFEKIFQSGSTLGVEFLITGLVLLYAERMNSGRKGIKETTVVDAVFIGILQGAAIMPAISRSGLTISGALFRDLDRTFAAKFSFLLSIPAILGAAVFDFKDLMDAGAGSINSTPLIAGAIAAAIAGFLSIKYMLELIRKGKLKYFSYYVFMVGALVLVDQFITHIYF